MELKQLEYFVRVAELGGFTKAAAALSVAQPILSKQVRRLEVELHQTLLQRNGRGASLTEEGTLLLAHAKGILEQAERARQEVSDVKGSPVGKVVLGAPPAAGTWVIANLMATFKSRFPRASLEIVEIKGWSIYEWLLLGRLDLGILYDPSPSPLIETVPLREEELFLVSAANTRSLTKSAKVPVRDLYRFPLILPSLPHTMRALLDAAAAKAGIKLDVTAQVEGAPFILELVRHGHGHTILPRHIAQGPHLHANAIVKPRLTRTLTVAVSAQRRVTYLTREVVKLICAAFNARAPEDDAASARR